MHSVYAVLSYGLAQCSTAAATHRIALSFSLASRCSVFPQFAVESATWRSVVGGWIGSIPTDLGNHRTADSRTTHPTG